MDISKIIYGNILIVDDRQENREAAAQAIPAADIAGNTAEAIEMMARREYDLVLTDMQMETPIAGFAVVKEALAKNAIPYILSHACPDHGASSVIMRPYCGLIRSVNEKADADTWIEALRRIENTEDAHLLYHQALGGAKAAARSVVLDDSVITAIYFVKPYQKGGNEYDN